MALDKKYIEMLDNCLAKYCQPMYQRMQPPLERDVIEAYFNKWQIADEKLIDLFLWKNGIEKDASLERSFSYNYTGFGVIPSLQYIDNEFESAKAFTTWQTRHFPLITSFTGDFLLLDTNKESNTQGMLFLQCPTFGNVGEFVVSYYDAIEQMITTIVECFETKVFVYDKLEMELNRDIDAYFEIAKKNNPLSEYWQDT